MLRSTFLATAGVLVGLVATAPAQNVLFDFNGGPQYSGTPLDQFSGGIRAHFTGTGSGYSIQDIAQVIGVLPTGFSGLGLSPNSVFGADLLISFWDATTGAAQYLDGAAILTAPQELACDSSSTMRISAYDGTTLVGSTTAISNDQNFTWPMIDLSFASTLPFDNVVIHFESGPPTGGDWGPIFVADNLTVTPSPAPEPSAFAGLTIGLIAILRLRRAR